MKRDELIAAENTKRWAFIEHSVKEIETWTDGEKVELGGRPDLQRDTDIQKLLQTQIHSYDDLQANARLIWESGYDAAQAQIDPYREALRWIPVDDRLPDETGDYLVRNQQGSVDVAYFVKESGRLMDADGTECYDASHWMPIPPFKARLGEGGE